MLFGFHLCNSFFFFGGRGGKGVWGDVGEGGGSNPLGCVMCEHLPNKKNLYFILVELN